MTLAWQAVARGGVPALAIAWRAFEVSSRDQPYPWLQATYDMYHSLSIGPDDEAPGHGKTAWGHQILACVHEVSTFPYDLPSALPAFFHR